MYTDQIFSALVKGLPLIVVLVGKGEKLRTKIRQQSTFDYEPCIAE
jgi:hypothetical protein